jgi:hypothetical protein
MCCTRTAIVGIDPRFEFGSTQQPVGFCDGPFPMHPLRCNGVAPGTFTGQVADDAAHPCGPMFAPLLVLAHPGSDGLATVPGGIVPDQPQGGEALGRASGRAPRQASNRHGTHRTPRDKPAPPLVRRLRPRPYQQPIPGQGLGIGGGRRPRQLLQPIRGLGVGPSMLIGLREAAPPDCIATAQGPRRLGVGPSDQPGAAFFCGARPDRDW